MGRAGPAASPMWPTAWSTAAAKSSWAICRPRLRRDGPRACDYCVVLVGPSTHHAAPTCGIGPSAPFCEPSSPDPEVRFFGVLPPALGVLTISSKTMGCASMQRQPQPIGHVPACSHAAPSTHSWMPLSAFDIQSCMHARCPPWPQAPQNHDKPLTGMQHTAHRQRKRFSSRAVAACGCG